MERPKPPPPYVAPPPLFGPPVPFCLKMSENHAEIAGNQVWGAQKYNPPPPPKGNTSPLLLFSLKSLFVVGPSTEKSLKKALCHLGLIFYLIDNY